MAPIPSVYHQENFQARKNDLILDKNLRSCTVNIKNKSGAGEYLVTDCNQKSEETSKHGTKHFQQHFLSEKSVSPDLEQAKSPIALRYWNYCINRPDLDRPISNAPWTVKSLQQETYEIPNEKKNAHLAPRRRPQTPSPIPASSSTSSAAAQQRKRSESVPRTFRTFKVTARVESPSPVPFVQNNSEIDSVTPKPDCSNQVVPHRNINSELTLSNSMKLKSEQETKMKFRTEENGVRSPVFMMNQKPYQPKSHSPLISQELSLSKSSSPLSDRPPTPRRKKSPTFNENSTSNNKKSLTSNDDYTFPNDPLTANKSTNEFKIETKSAEANCDHELKKQEIGHDKCLDLSQLTKLPQKEINIVVASLFDQASDDVKLSLLLDCLPKLSVKKILADMSDKEKEVTKERLRVMTHSLVHQKRRDHTR